MGYISSKKYGTSVQHYKKSNGDITYYITFKDENNKLKRLKIGEKSAGITETYCNQKRLEVLNQIRLGEDAPIVVRRKQKKTIKLNDIADLYFKIKEASISGDISKHYRRYPPNLKEKFGECDINSITTNKIFNYQLEINNKGYAPATINYNINFLGTLFNLAIEEKLYKHPNPVKSKKIKKLKVNNERERYLTVQEVNKLYSLIDDENVKLFIELALSTGGRFESILNIQVKDINLENKMITLKDFKNNSNYKGFIRTSLALYLKEFIANLSANTFIIGRDVKKFPSRTMQRKMKNTLDPLFNVGLYSRDTKNRVVIHTLRHTFASHLAMNGTPIFTIQKLMNHKDIKQTMRYAKLAPDSGKNFVENLYK